ncbi:MAG: hypothetical protein ABFQ62_00020 [Patescibacteria group bacterium]
MPLPNVFSDKKDPYLFLAVFLSDTAVRSALWRIDEGEIEILKTSKPHDFSDVEALLLKTDQSLQELGEMSEKTDQVLFCLKSSWANGGISDDKKPILKKLSSNLSLKVVGFVVGSEVILDYLKNEKAVNASLLLTLEKSSLELLFVEGGSILSRENVGRSDDLSADLAEALARLEKSPSVSKRSYPPRMILHSTEVSDAEISKQQQKLIKKDWRESHNFLQRPVVEIINTKESIEAIIKTGGKVVGKAKGLISDQDATSEKLVIASSGQETATTEETDFGFQELGTKQLTKQGIASLIKAKNKPKVDRSLFHQQAGLTEKIRLNPGNIMEEISHHKLAALGFVMGLIFLFFGSIIALFSMAKVSILLTPVSQNINKDIAITLDSNIEESDFNEMILAARVTEKAVTGSNTAPSTGVKIIGDAASGKVEILNKTDSEKTFAKGTQISADGKVFAIDEEVIVSAAKITIDEDSDIETKVPGKKEVGVIAQEIGAESNIVADFKFAVEDFSASSYEAKSIEAFTGGASREIQVVSKQDVADISISLKEELIKLASDEFANESKDAMYFVVTGKSKILSESFDAEIGDEVNTFSLSLELAVEAYSYNAQDLLPLAKVVLKSELPDGFILTGRPQILSSPSESEEESDDVILEANLSSDAYANLNTDSLLSEIFNKSINEAEKLLNSKNEITNVVVNFEPALAASLIKKIPKDEKRVTIIVSGAE